MIKRWTSQSLRKVGILSAFCGIVIVFSLPSESTATDPAVIADGILSEAIPNLQNYMVSMSQGCSGGASGVPPLNWGTTQVHGSAAVNAFSAARTALATHQNQIAVQQIDAGLSELDLLIGGLHQNCSGGSNGVDPVYFGNYVSFRDNIKTELNTTKKFL